MHTVVFLEKVLFSAKSILGPNLAFWGLCFLIVLVAFSASSEELRSYALYSVQAVCAYVDRMASLRKSNQLFVSWAGPHRDKPYTKQRL